MDFKENLKRLRKNKKLTQKQLGELIGKKEITVRNYESGKAVPPLKVIEEIAKALNTSINELVTGAKEASLWNFKEDHLHEDMAIRYEKMEEIEKKVFAKFLNIFSTDLQEYFKLLSEETMTDEEIESLCEDTQNFIHYLLTKLKDSKIFGIEGELDADIDI